MNQSERCRICLPRFFTQAKSPTNRMLSWPTSHPTDCHVDGEKSVKSKRPGSRRNPAAEFCVIEETLESLLDREVPEAAFGVCLSLVVTLVIRQEVTRNEGWLVVHHILHSEGKSHVIEPSSPSAR